MIDHLDHLLFTLFRTSVAELSADGQIRFQAPDEDWRALVPTISDGAGNPGNSLNVYLVELRENRRLRSNERERVTVGTDVFEVPPPRRVDCHYLISAWSPVTPGPAIDPTPDEHALLAEVNSIDVWTDGGTSARVIRSNPNFGKYCSAVVVSRNTTGACKSDASRSAACVR